MRASTSRLVSRFDGSDAADPTAAMATLVDVMLVFACGLMAAIVSSRAGVKMPSDELAAEPRGGKDVQRARALPSLPPGLGDVGAGFQAVGRVFRDPKTGQLILVESASASTPPKR